VTVDGIVVYLLEGADESGLAEPSADRRVIYDVTGEHSVTWHGEDGAGSRVAPGIYFSALETEGEVVSRKLVSVR